MTEFALYREPTLLDSLLHRQLRLKLTPQPDHSAAARMHASYLGAMEFPAAAREYVIVFVRDTAGAADSSVSPVALLGITPGENLFVDGPLWDAQYVPAYVRRYPFWTTHLEGQAAGSVMFDAWWSGFSETEGDALFTADGTPAPRLAEVIEFIRMFDQEAARTREVCAYLARLDLFREMTADVTLPDGSTRTLSDFLVIDDAKLKALPDAVALDMFRSGVLYLVHAHQLSLANLQALAGRKGRRLQAAA